MLLLRCGSNANRTPCLNHLYQVLLYANIHIEIEAHEHSNELSY